MKSSFLLVAAALGLAGCEEVRAVIADVNSRAASEDERQIIEAVLDHEASLPRENPPVCLARRTEGGAFDRDRDHFRSLREARPQNPRDAEIIRQALAGSQTLMHEWRRPVPSRDRRYAEGPRVEGSEADRLDVAARRLINGPARAAEPVAIDPELIPRPLGGWNMVSCSTLNLTAPAISNEIAFVESAYACGGLCGNGWLYALERKEGRWQLVAVAFTWVS
jgi:hypothetical protein